MDNMVNIFFRGMSDVPVGQIKQLASLIVAIVFLVLPWYVCGTLVTGKSIALSTPGNNCHRPGCQYLTVVPVKTFILKYNYYKCIFLCESMLSLYWRLSDVTK